MLNKKLFNKESIYFISFLTIFAILFSLGCWQLIRSKGKNEYIQGVLGSINKPAKKLIDIQNSNALYQKVKIKGKVLEDKIFWLYRRYAAAKYEEGAYLMLPIQDDEGNIIISLLGWVRKKDKDSIINDIKENNKLELEGILLQTEKNSYFVPKNDYKNKICFTVELNELSKEFENNLYPYFVAAFNSQKIFKTRIYEITPNMMIKIRNNHLEYAATWFILAAILCYIYYYSKKRKV